MCWVHLQISLKEMIKSTGLRFKRPQDQSNRVVSSLGYSAPQVEKIHLINLPLIPATCRHILF